MRYHRIKHTELNISKLSFGCMSLGDNYSFNEKLLNEAFDLGINFFDTADLYDHGRNEEHVGKALKSKRDQVILATKVGNQWLPDGESWTWNPTKKYILKSVERSLARLQTDYIDLYQLHGGTIQDPIEETIEAFETLLQQGKIRYYGISSIRPNVIREYLSSSNIVSVMMQYSLLDRRSEETCLDLIHEHGKSVLVRGALAKGWLINKTPNDYLGFSSEEIQSVQHLLHDYPQFWESPIQAAIHYCLNHPAVTTVVAGIRTQKQLKELVKYSDQQYSLSGDAIQYLRSSIKADQYQLHR